MGLVVLLGYFFVRWKWLDQHTLTHLTRILIDGIVPCAFIVAMVRGLNRSVFGVGATLMLLVSSWTLGAYVLCMLLYHLFPSTRRSEDRAVTAMTMIQNGIYLPLPVILAIVPPEQQDTATVYLAMAIIPLILLQWTLGVTLHSGKQAPDTRERIKNIFNPPLISLVVGAGLSFVPGFPEAALGDPTASLVLRMIFSAMQFVGQALTPLAMIMLGAFIGSSHALGRIRLRHLTPLIMIRLIAVPGTVLALMVSGWINLPAPAGIILAVEAAAPPATNHSLIARRYHGEWELVSSLQLVVHVAALITLPIWIALALNS